jgi:hypothetical protein
MGYDVMDTLEDYWLTPEQFYRPFYSNTVECDWFFHILRFFHFSDNTNQPDKNYDDCDRCWKIRTLL